MAEVMPRHREPAAEDVEMDGPAKTSNQPSNSSSNIARPSLMIGALQEEGVYIPPAKRRALEAQQLQDGGTTAATTAADVGSIARQRQTWQDQRRAVHGTINRLNASTIKPLIHDLFSKVNLIRMRGVLARSILRASVSSQRYTSVYAALVAVLNTKLPEVGELVVKRAIYTFRRSYRLKDKQSCLAVALLLGHLFHQAVVHELLILQILTLLLDGNPTDDSVEVAVEFMTCVGYALLEVSPAGVRAVLERLRALLHEGQLNNKRVEYKMEQLLALRKTGFRDHPPIPEELDLVEREDQITFEISLDDEDIQKEDHLDVFHVDKDYEENEKEWSKIRAEILGLGGEDDDDGESETEDSEEESEEESGGEKEADDGDMEETALVSAPSSQVVKIQDLSENDLIHLRRTIYLTIMSSATFEECTHKLAKIDIPMGREEELINMIIECCSQERTFLRYYGLIGARFCLMDDRWKQAFLDAFAAQYTTIHRLETNKLRNVAKLFAHLLHTDSMPWSCLGIIHLNEDETTSSSRIFVKILIQEMAESMGIAKLKSRFETNDPEMSDWYKGMFPKDNVRKTRYAINFFTSIGLGPLTDGLRDFLKNAPKMIMTQAQETALATKDGDDDDESSVSSSSSSSSSSVSSTSSSSSSSYSSTSSYSSSSYSRRRRSRRRRDRSSSYSSSSSPRSISSSRSTSTGQSDQRSRSPDRRSRSYSSDSRRRSRSFSRGREARSRRRSRSKSYNDGDRRIRSREATRKPSADGGSNEARERRKRSASRSPGRRGGKRQRSGRSHSSSSRRSRC